MVMRQKTATSFSCADTLAHSDETSSHVVRCLWKERPMGQGTKGGLEPTAHEELNPAKNYMSELGRGSILIKPSDDNSP